MSAIFLYKNLKKRKYIEDKISFSNSDRKHEHLEINTRRNIWCPYKDNNTKLMKDMKSKPY